LAAGPVSLSIGSRRYQRADGCQPLLGTVGLWASRFSCF